MVCSHYPTLTLTQTTMKNGMYRIVWICSHCPTDTDAIGLHTHFVSVGVGVVVGQCQHTIPPSRFAFDGKDQSENKVSSLNVNKIAFQ